MTGRIGLDVKIFLIYHKPLQISQKRHFCRQKNLVDANLPVLVASSLLPPRHNHINNSRVQQGGGIPKVAKVSLDDLAQDATHDFATTGLG